MFSELNSILRCDLLDKKKKQQHACSPTSPSTNSDQPAHTSDQSELKTIGRYPYETSANTRCQHHFQTLAALQRPGISQPNIHVTYDNDFKARKSHYILLIQTDTQLWSLWQ